MANRPGHEPKWAQRKNNRTVVQAGPYYLDKRVHSSAVPIPESDADEDRIKVHACGRNNTDVWLRQGAYGNETGPATISRWQRGDSTLVFPCIQGTDIVGVIDAVGDHVSQARIGERVIADFFIYHRPEGDGSLADIDYIVCSAHIVARARPRDNTVPIRAWAPARPVKIAVHSGEREAASSDAD